MMGQASLFDALHAPPVIVKCDPDGSVLQGEPDETIRFKHKIRFLDRVRIELHKHDDGLWMWSTSVHADTGGYTYKVGAKWGKFALSRDDALFYAIAEIRERIGENPGPEAKQVLSWLDGLQ